MTSDALAAVSRASRKVGHAVIHGVLRPVVTIGANRGPKTVSAMLRVKNEEEYLREVVLSIVDVVEEIVIIDNQSTDTTPEIIASLVASHPHKIRTADYPYDVARYGEENRKLASTFRGRRSPRLLANFYNWSMAQCRYDYILKWDGDTIATEAFRAKMLDFKKPVPKPNRAKQALWMTGVNLHPDLMHLIKVLPSEPMEPRLVCRRFAKYTNYLGYCEGIVSPYIRRFIEFSDFFEEPSYLHMKFCKRNRYSHMSNDVKKVFVDDGDVPGDDVSPTVQAEIERWRLVAR